MMESRSEPLRYQDTLSIWELAHRLFDFHPDETNPKSLPLEVQDTIRNIVLSDGFNFYDIDGAEVLDIALIGKLVYPFRTRVETQVRKRQFKKAILDRLYIDREQFAEWWLQRRFLWEDEVSLPPFWFDKYEIESQEEEYQRQYGNAPDCGTEDEASPQQALAAYARHQPKHLIKQNLIRYWLAKGFQKGQEDLAAEQFFNSLSQEDQRLLTPSKILNNAKRTLKSALRSYLDQESPPPAFLKDFKP